jgi:glutathione S-transferase
MKLRYSPASPFVRKVLVVAHETGQAGRIETIQTDVWDEAGGIRADNPLARIPALITDDGTILYDSPVICEYLDSLHDGERLFPEGAARIVALKQQALADGICDAAVLRRIETVMRPAELRWAKWIERQRLAMAAGLDALEAESGALEGRFTIGTLTVAVMLAYLDLRWADEPWREGRPKLARWHEAIAQRPSLVATAVKA